MFYEVQVEVLTESETGRLKKIKEHFPGTNFINTKQIHKLF